MRLAFVSIGQTPRTDVIADIVSNLRINADVIEIGVLDGLSDAEIDVLRPRGDEPIIVTQLRDGSVIKLSKTRMSDRLNDIVSRFSRTDYDLIVILSTGLIRDFESQSMTVNAQRAMEAGIAALASHGARLGIIQPVVEQVVDAKVVGLSGYHIERSHAAPRDGQALRQAVAQLAGCEILVLNSIGYNEGDKALVAELSGRPVVLARRLVASAVSLLLNSRRDPAAQPPCNDLAEKMERLTPRERQVMSLAAEGLSNKAIGRQLGISPKTVEIHRSKVMSKLEVPSTLALIRLVLSAELPGIA